MWIDVVGGVIDYGLRSHVAKLINFEASVAVATETKCFFMFRPSINIVHEESEPVIGRGDLQTPVTAEGVINMEGGSRTRMRPLSISTSVTRSQKNNVHA
jgi:hypothetical protein